MHALEQLTSLLAHCRAGTITSPRVAAAVMMDWTAATAPVASVGDIAIRSSPSESASSAGLVARPKGRVPMKTRAFRIRQGGGEE